MTALYAGLMSGTSTDGIDGVLADFSQPDRPEIVAQSTIAMPPTLRRDVLALNSPGPNELARAAMAANALARLYAETVGHLLTRGSARVEDVNAVGVHGQSVRHAPDSGYTIQLNAPALLAELTHIDVIADFRSRDIAAGGQGAPLVPAFHHALFGCDYPRAVLNLGGIANITLLHPHQPVHGFDTGPANVLLDWWCQHKTGAAYDVGGQWAATGKSVQALLDTLIASEPWFAHPPPKSTGRDRFNQDWLESRLATYRESNLGDSDVQATLQSLTAQTVASAIARHAPETREILVCGGGAFNDSLMTELARRVALPVVPTSRLGMPEQLVESLAFAWLAWAHVVGFPAGMPSVTGSRHPTILGARYPA